MYHQVSYFVLFSGMKMSSLTAASSTLVARVPNIVEHLQYTFSNLYIQTTLGDEWNNDPFYRWGNFGTERVTFPCHTLGNMLIEYSMPSVELEQGFPNWTACWNRVSNKFPGWRGLLRERWRQSIAEKRGKKLFSAVFYLGPLLTPF